MGCAGSNSIAEEQPKENQKAKKEEKIIEEEEEKEQKEKQNYLYCYSEEEKDLIQNILKEKKFEKDKIIFNKVIVDFNKDFTSFKEYLTIQTEKIRGQKYSGKYSFISSINIFPKNDSCTVKINNNSIETIKNIPSFNYKQIDIEYNLNENDKDRKSTLTLKQ